MRRPSDDHYETLQISKNADQETIQRVFRMLAQRFHPDNLDTGDEARFREIHEAFLVLSDPEKRAEYDVRHETFKQERWRFIAAGPPGETDFGVEQQMRFMLLGDSLQPPPDRAESPGPVTARAARAARAPSRAPRIHYLVSGAEEARDPRRSVEPGDYR